MGSPGWHFWEFHDALEGFRLLRGLNADVHQMNFHLPVKSFVSTEIKNLSKKIVFFLNPPVRSGHWKQILGILRFLLFTTCTRIFEKIVESYFQKQSGFDCRTLFRRDSFQCELQYLKPFDSKVWIQNGFELKLMVVNGEKTELASTSGEYKCQNARSKRRKVSKILIQTLWLKTVCLED